MQPGGAAAISAHAIQRRFAVTNAGDGPVPPIAETICETGSRQGRSTSQVARPRRHHARDGTPMAGAMPVAAIESDLIVYHRCA